jgi:phospholipid/cholesterol/gamma-HCH transport system substrate-binding protein
MQKNLLETLIGAVVLIIAGVFFVFAYKGSQIHVDSDGYRISGRFSDVSGIGIGSDVRIGGIKVGVVSNMALDPETYQASVTMQIGKSTQLPKDSSAGVVSSGLLGEKFIQITPGGDEKMLADGGRIEFTQSSVNLEQLIGKFMFSGGGVDSKDEPKQP